MQIVKFYGLVFSVEIKCKMKLWQLKEIFEWDE